MKQKKRMSEDDFIVGLFGKPIKNIDEVKRSLSDQSVYLKSEYDKVLSAKLFGKSVFFSELQTPAPPKKAPEPMLIHDLEILTNDDYFFEEHESDDDEDDDAKEPIEPKIEIAVRIEKAYSFFMEYYQLLLLSTDKKIPDDKKTTMRDFSMFINGLDSKSVPTANLFLLNAAQKCLESCVSLAEFIQNQ